MWRRPSGFLLCKSSGFSRTAGYQDKGELNPPWVFCYLFSRVGFLPPGLKRADTRCEFTCRVSHRGTFRWELNKPRGAGEEGLGVSVSEVGIKMEGDKEPPLLVHYSVASRKRGRPKKIQDGATTSELHGPFL